MRNSLDPEVKVALNEEFRKVNPTARIVLTDDGYLEFLASFVSREHTKLKAYRQGDKHDHPYDGVRKEPLCTCADRYCAFKEGRLMRQIREADDPVAEIRRVKHSHSGDVLVLQDASDEYDEICAEFDHAHRRIIICGQYNTHPDDLDGLTPTTDDDETDEQGGTGVAGD